MAIVNKYFTEEDYVASEDITRAVFKVLADHVSEGDIDDVISSLPKPLRKLWE